MSARKFEATFDSLRGFECPSWFRDAKLGFWSHWGPQSVPMFGDWYARNMYIEGTPQYLYHLRHYGHPSKFGYKDLVKLWKAEKFDPDALMDLYVKAGARYFVGQAMHHDHFFNFPSKLNPFNAIGMGPQKDIIGMWKKAADNHKLPFGLTEHLGATFSWWNVNKGADKHGPYAGIPYDGNDPAYRDYYMDNYEHYTKDEDMSQVKDWYTSNPKHHAYWLSVMKELIDLYTPDLLYSDGGLPFGTRGQGHFAYNAPDDDPAYRWGLEAVAYLYNKSIDKHGENRALYNQKDKRPEIYTVGVLDIEKSQLPGINPAPWQTDTCIGNWFYDVRQEFKRPGHVIEMLIDIIAKNGTMLLNILQLPNGAVDDETQYLLKELASWIPICGEGVYGTRPWRISGEGFSTVLIDGFREEAVGWTDTDFRFTAKGKTVYAFMMRVPENRAAVIKSFTLNEKVLSVKLLGSGSVSFSQNYGVLTVKLPETLPTSYTNCLAVELAG
ncbi:alpha-L-fucosidase [Leadbettera azotonutricia]|uniref:alpha-L-fucosidase n=1 Tax=Leadbettera azotonutricia (strain ATCC BAA-888 / DSM 13862 / ZAS-9) TaxID=545695 RepID=F5YF88_LEAAZ|nr:alpha-L-fucosidase [Leadbettera azotonutricia]AEF83499.1 alpha-L-fucosidase [Leadbettera azotonutricia ZAS-9]